MTLKFSELLSYFKCLDRSSIHEATKGKALSLVFLLFTFSTVDCSGLWTALYCSRLLWTAVVCCGPLGTIVDYCGLLWTVGDCCGLLGTVVDCCGMVSTVVDCCGLLCTVVDFSGLLLKSPGICLMYQGLTNTSSRVIKMPENANIFGFVLKLQLYFWADLKKFKMHV